MEPVSTDDRAAALKATRVAIDKIIQQADALSELTGRSAGGREVSLTKTKLQEAKMWLGKALGELGTKLPEAYRDEFISPDPPSAEL